MGVVTVFMVVAVVAVVMVALDSALMQGGKAERKGQQGKEVVVATRKGKQGARVAVLCLQQSEYARGCSKRRRKGRRQQSGGG